MGILDELELAPRTAPKIYSHQDPLLNARSRVIDGLLSTGREAAAWIKTNELDASKRHWFKPDGEKGARLTLRLGLNLIELKPGMTDIVIRDKKQLPKLIEQLVDATQNGELDEPLERTLKSIKPRKGGGGRPRKEV